MFDHIGIKVRDLEVSLRFYDAVLGPLGFERNASAEDGDGYGLPGTPGLWLYPGGSGGTAVHLAFQASARPLVDRFYEAGLGAGGGDNGRPGPRADYSPTYYAAFLIDPDGNNVEAVCLKESD
jgi:catechol 2,3-dioxygenase-like lactoylglutathione lyase family enzyme